MRGNGSEDHAAPSAIEARGDAIDELIAQLEERARGAGRGNGGGGDGNGGSGGGGDDGGGDDFVRFVRLLIPGLRRLAEQQSDFTQRATNAMLDAIKAEIEARRNEARQLGEGVTQALRQNADLAERTADWAAALSARVEALERQLAEQRSSSK